MDTPREVRDDGQGTTWIGVNALATAGTEGKVPVVCTPSGGALSDEDLLAAIAAGRD